MRMSVAVQKLCLFVNPSWRRGTLHSPLLFPFWGNPTAESSLFAKELFDRYSFDTSLYTITDRIENANIVFAPYRHVWMLMHNPALLAECAQTAEKSGLPLLLDGMGDIEYPITTKNTYVLRMGGYRFLPEKNRIQIPAAADDLLERCARGLFQVRRKREGERPVVGFAGWAQLAPWQKLRTVVKEVPIRTRGLVDARYSAMQKGVLWRRRALDLLEHSNIVTLRAIRRRSYSGISKTAEADMSQLRQEFVDLILASDYGLDVRGDTNESMRLYEVMSLGRIPVILDTERNLPFRDDVKYEDFSLIVDFRDIKRLPERVADFHRTVSAERFESMQFAAREAFVTHLRIDALMAHIIRSLRQYGAIQ